MKTFRFRLDSALRWRAAQNDLAKSRVAAAARRLLDLRGEIDALRTGLKDGSGQLTPVASGSALQLWNAYTARTLRRIAELEKAAHKAGQDLTAQTQALLEANRKLRLVENLERTSRAEWRSDFNRELEAFAGEAFLGRLQSRERARSSGG